jgi:hypothetical protein
MKSTWRKEREESLAGVMKEKRAVKDGKRAGKFRGAV